MQEFTLRKSAYICGRKKGFPRIFADERRWIANKLLCVNLRTSAGEKRVSRGFSQMYADEMQADYFV